MFIYEGKDLTFVCTLSLFLSSFGVYVCITADLLTTIEFDETGDYLATGDRGGRVVIFEKGDDIKQVGDVVMFS